MQAGARRARQIAARLRRSLQPAGCLPAADQPSRAAPLQRLRTARGHFARAAAAGCFAGDASRATARGGQMRPGRREFLAGSGALAGLAALGGCAPLMARARADVLIVNARVATLNPRQPNAAAIAIRDRKSTRLNSSHTVISYAVFCLKKKKKKKKNKI